MKTVKLSRVNECLALLATVPGETIDIYAADVYVNGGKRGQSRVYNAVMTLVNAGILRGPWMN